MGNRPVQYSSACQSGTQFRVLSICGLGVRPCQPGTLSWRRNRGGSGFKKIGNILNHNKGRDFRPDFLFLKKKVISQELDPDLKYVPDVQNKIETKDSVFEN